jgi:putative transposase
MHIGSPKPTPEQSIMPQSLSNIAIHLTFSTKERERALAYPELRSQLEGYLVGALSNLGCPSISTRAEIDHIHTLFALSRTETVSHVVQMLKQESSKWIKLQLPDRKDPRLVKFGWQKGYGAFSVSESVVPRVKAYIEGQTEHHKRMTFQEEYRGFLEKHGIEYDERYVWD